MVSYADILALGSDVLTLVTERVVPPLLILMIGIMLGRVIKNLLSKFFESVELEKHLRNIIGARAQYNELLAGAVAAAVYTVAVVWSFWLAGIIRYALYAVLLFLGAIIVLGFVLLLRDFFSNVFSRQAVKSVLAKGDVVSLQGVSGPLKRFGLMHAVLSYKNNRVVVPYRTLRLSLKKLK